MSIKRWAAARSGDTTDLCEAAMNCSTPVEAAQIMAEASARSRTGRLRARVQELLAERMPHMALGMAAMAAEVL